jgi:tellurite resistance protein TerC
MVPQLYQWIGFHVLILICVYLDLKEIKESDNDVSVKHSLKLSLVWIGLALIFNIFIYFDRGAEQALNFFTSYLIEKALSLDNLFVFLAIFSFFKISPQQQKFILLQGILTALVLRLVLILVGIELLESFAWTQYFFGLF